MEPKTELKPGPKLTEEQREQLLLMLAAEHDTPCIQKDFEGRGWPVVSRAVVSYYRTRYATEVADVRAARRTSALNTGLALVEERVARLSEHANYLQAILYETDKNGRMWHCKEWRDTLAAIAAEVGGRRRHVNVDLTAQVNSVLAEIEQLVNSIMEDEDTAALDV